MNLYEIYDGFADDYRRYMLVIAGSEDEAKEKGEKLWKEAGYPEIEPFVRKRKETTHHALGNRYRSADGIYFCESYDSGCGFWMAGNGDRKNVSERAIGRTFHRIYTETP